MANELDLNRIWKDYVDRATQDIFHTIKLHGAEGDDFYHAVDGETIAHRCFGEPSLIYCVIHEMVKQGWLRAEFDDANTSYAITAEGWKHFK